MYRINLQKTGVGRQRIEPMHGLATKIIASDATQYRRVVSEPSGHHTEICGRTAQARPLGQHVPKQLPYSQD
jgi:hypothetical protein